MAAKVDPRDWNRLFRSGAPRRGGPLRILANVLIFGIVLALLGAAAFFGLRFGVERTQQNVENTRVAVETQNAVVFATRTAFALSTATAQVLAAVTPEPTVETLIGRGSVLAGGNLRNEPLVVPETVIGQICPGDQIVFLEQRSTDTGQWYRIRIVETAADCTAERVSVGSSGWASSTLLSQPAP